MTKSQKSDKNRDNDYTKTLKVTSYLGKEGSGKNDTLRNFFGI